MFRRREHLHRRQRSVGRRTRHVEYGSSSGGTSRGGHWKDRLRRMVLRRIVCRSRRRLGVVRHADAEDPIEHQGSMHVLLRGIRREHQSQIGHHLRTLFDDGSAANTSHDPTDRSAIRTRRGIHASLPRRRDPPLPHHHHDDGPHTRPPPRLRKLPPPRRHRRRHHRRPFHHRRQTRYLPLPLPHARRRHSRHSRRTHSIRLVPTPRSGTPIGPPHHVSPNRLRFGRNVRYRRR
mmetsp:Transcript_3371/g.7468  ORF Transcript_3371/g.7468 Transcript_3371/m.7468 type:complete len:234 (+) Transcript_3371:1646-2347(+)